MCVIIAKYFPDHGWVAVKNRDRNYTPEISFSRYHDRDTGTERLLFEDDITKYAEGINSHGVGILSASLMVINDEKEITTKSSKKISPDGRRIKAALLLPSARAAMFECIRSRLTGNNIFVDDDDCYLLESCIRNGRYGYRYGRIPRGQTVARTNHGIWLPWAGYQRDRDENQHLSRISSEARLAQAQAVVETARDPQDMIDGLVKTFVDHPQLNVLRTDTKRKKMRTTAQEMIIPRERTLFCRPVSSHMIFDFWKLNKPGSDTWVEILSNRVLYRGLRDQDEPPFGNSNNNNKHRIKEYTLWQ